MRPTLIFLGSPTLVPGSCCSLLAFRRRTNLFYFLAKYWWLQLYPVSDWLSKPRARLWLLLPFDTATPKKIDWYSISEEVLWIQTSRMLPLRRSWNWLYKEKPESVIACYVIYRSSSSRRGLSMLLRVTGVLITEALSMTPFSVDCVSPDGGICTCTNKQTIFQTLWMSDLFPFRKTLLFVIGLSLPLTGDRQRNGISCNSKTTHSI